MSTSSLRFALILSLLAVFSLSACTESGTGEDTNIVPEDIPGALYSCRYKNPFSSVDECRTYYGGWTRSQVEEECGQVFTNVSGEVSQNDCVNDGSIGICTSIADDSGLFFKIWFYGGEAAVTGRLCAEFLNGTWESLGSEDMPAPMMTTPLEEALSYLVSDDEVVVTPACDNDDCLVDLVNATEGIEFKPALTAPTTGFIIYPGAAVDPRAYAPIARGIARNGVLSVIVPMPGNFALNGWGRANDIIAAHPEINAWYLGGHSMGGAMTAHFAKENPGIMKGLILWAAYPGGADDLSASNEKVMSIYGNMDGIATLDEIEAGKPLLPPSTQYIEIRGGNHAQFGIYGDQDGDQVADIPAAVQHQQIIGATTHFIRSTEAEVPPTINPIFEDAPTTGWCGEAQRIVAAVEAPLESSSYVITNYEIIDEFARSKPNWDPSASTPLELSAYVRDQGNATRLDAPPIFAREIWCKLKSQELLMAQMSTTPNGEPGTCADINQAVIEWAKAQLDTERTARLSALAPQFTFTTDEEFETGLEWLGDGQLLVEDQSSDNDMTYSIRSSSLKVGSQADIPEADRLPEAYLNVVYCKLMAPAEALRWLLTLTD